MITFHRFLLISTCFTFWNWTCTYSQQGTMTDNRDGEVYAIATIGKQIWMAENLRYEIANSWVNPNYPSKTYGRLYDGTTAQHICPEGWHLPSDAEWNELEMYLGMPADEAHKTGWRGKHGTQMKSTRGWFGEGNGTNSSGFNAVPAGYFFEGDLEGGFTASVGFWTYAENHLSWIRFIGAPLDGVNRMESDLTGGLACRCLKD